MISPGFPNYLDSPVLLDLSLGDSRSITHPVSLELSLLNSAPLRLLPRYTLNTLERSFGHLLDNALSDQRLCLVPPHQVDRVFAQIHHSVGCRV